MKLYRNNLYSGLDPEQTTPQALQEKLTAEVYPGKRQWTAMLEIAVLVLGVGFALAGIIFFFAYNWADMGPFFKFTLIAALITAAVAVAVFTRKKKIINQIALSAASVLVGTLFAVYGQVYQTGADSYTIFLWWTIAILPWTVVSLFPPLWMLFLVIANTTVLLFIDQVPLADNTYYTVFSIMLIINCLCVVLVEYLKKKVAALATVRVDWFLSVVTSAMIIAATIFLSYFSISEVETSQELLLTFTCVGILAAAIWYSVRCRSLLYIGVALLGVIIIGLCLLINVCDNEYLYFAATLSILIISVLSTVSASIYGLIKLKKRWDEK